jgi:protein-tyrosine phosphatase
LLDHPDRVVRLAGASNFRDLGGYPAVDGRAVRWRRLYRSDHLAGLTPGDQAHLAERGVATAFDFRGVDERAATPYHVPGLVQHALSIEPTVVQGMEAVRAAGETLTVPVVEGLMEDLYRRLIGEQPRRFAEFFAHLLRAERPVVFHCTAGKDRTGVAAALLLMALGVPREAVMQDYLLTNRLYQPPRPVDPPFSEAVLARLWGVRENYLDAAFGALDAVPGGFEGYLAEQLGVRQAERAALRQRFLDDGRSG